MRQNLFVSASLVCNGCASSSICLPKPGGSSNACLCPTYWGNVKKGSGCSPPNTFIAMGVMRGVQLADLTPRDDGRTPHLHTVYKGSSYFSNMVAIAYSPSTQIFYIAEVNRWVSVLCIGTFFMNNILYRCVVKVLNLKHFRRLILQRKIDGSESKILLDWKNVGNANAGIIDGMALDDAAGVLYMTDYSAVRIGVIGTVG